MIGSIALAICLVCPLADLFDHWDNALQTGHDSEYPMMIVALCVGAALELGRFLIKFSPDRSGSRLRAAAPSCLQSLFFGARPLAFATALASAGPPFSLRI